ncbi:SGNH/GDSL hydrolase family protein [Niallia sp.]|uniref:SGNH/GDSL hydrolase family protein n=1 Tax=Niallia sp. TaxID=2837523 RepID=UPI00289B4C5C|nr:SGNH/GDSL hydrolase family protein [Niallia sp.]
MKAAILSILSIILVVVLVIGNIHWNIRDESPLSSIQSDKDTDTEVAEPETYFNLDYYMSFAKSWPDHAQEVLESKLTDKQSFHILLIGSDAIGDQDLGLITPLKEALANKYDQYVTIDSIAYDGTTSDYVKDEAYEALIDKKPDMVIFEPFLLHDNREKFDTSKTLTNINKVIKATQDELPDVTFILMPAHQLYDANLYPMQVSDIQKYAEAQDIPFWNHWEVWPDGKDEKVQDYYKELDDNTSIANEQGFALWSNYLAKKLIAK